MEPTWFAPAERASEDTVRAQTAALQDNALLEELYQAVSDVILILNPQRQVVFYNRNLLAALGVSGGAFCGARPGEVLGCLRAEAGPGGCGTSEFCRECGAVQAILASQQGKADIRECRILKDNGDALDLLVKASPLSLQGNPFTVFTVKDIGDSKRRSALEKIFFHDILNTAEGIRHLTEMLALDLEGPPPEALSLLASSSLTLVEEIVAQRQLTAAENQELKANLRTVWFGPLAARVRDLYWPLAEGRGKAVVLAPGIPDLSLRTDPALLCRVLGNLVKNGLEACHRGQCVTLGGRSEEAWAVLEVRNPGHIPEGHQRQVFQRSFTTKGPGRGLGTYGAKLLTERYLGGRIGFRSDPEGGTVFEVRVPLAGTEPR